MPRNFPAAAILLVAIYLPVFGTAQDTNNSQDTTATSPAPKKAPGLGDPGKLVSISIETGRAKDGKFVLAGRDSSQQLVVTGHYETGQVRDLTRKVTYETADAKIAAVDSTGHVTPVSEGACSLSVRSEEGISSNISLQVTNIQQDTPINFANQITPIFTKHGCNGGGCHGKSGGQNGFRLSLLGFEPKEDFEYLVNEGRGRRIFPGSPDKSLLLTKAVAAVPHGGGQRIEPDSPSYRLLRRWIVQGMPYGKTTDATVARIEVIPSMRLMSRNSKQQLTVVAHLSDGTTEDVTRMTQFDSNDTEMAESNVTGLVTTGLLTGSVAVMARYQGQVDVFRATIPMGLPINETPPVKNFVDELVFKKLKDLGLPPSKLSDDASFLRRVFVDLVGRIPSLEESQAFLGDNDPAKREKLVDRLLDSTDYAEYFANKWNAVLRNKRKQDQDKIATFAFHDWIRESFHQNKPYDQFVREILTATGDPGESPTVAWYKEVKDASAQVEDTAQLFLGLRIQCARCHHHPFEKWSQQDYYGFQAFFSQVGRKKSNLPGQERIFHRPGVAQAQNPKTKSNVKPTGLGAASLDIAAEVDPRHALADWMSDPSNPFFARALVNRYWKHFLSRGLVDPEDDMRVTNPSTNPELLDGLANDFISHKFDLKHLIRSIVNSSTYQLSSEPNEWNRDDKQNFSRYYPKRLNAEVLLDAIDQVTAAPTNFGAIPVGTRAVQLPDNGFSSYFLTVFGRPESSSACECERSSEANLAQSLHLLNSAEIQGKLTANSGRAAAFSADKNRDHQSKIRELYLRTFSREPSSDELSIALAHLQKAGENTRPAYEDIVWALINTKEFLFNH